MGQTVFVVHADASLRRSLKEPLGQAGYRVEAAAELGAGAATEASRADLILIPWTAEATTRELLGRLKQAEGSVRTRVIVLAPQPRIFAAIRALGYGADDCLPVPFTTEELLARVDACLKRPPVGLDIERLGAGPIVLDKAVHSVWIANQSVELAPTEFRLLAFFLENQGRVFSRSELLRHAWSRHIKAGPRTVDVHVRRLRRVLEPSGCDHMIQTVRGFGYLFSAAARQESVSQQLGRRSARLARP